MSPTKVIPSFQVIAPADLLGDDAADLDFLASEFFLAKTYGNDSLEIAAPAELLPMLATAAGAFDAAEMPENFRLVEMTAEE